MTQRIIHHFLIDRSSVSQEWTLKNNELINKNLKRIRERAAASPDEKHYINLSLYNEQIDKVYSLLPIEEMEDITFTDYNADGKSALFDALDMTVSDLKKQLSGLREAENTSVELLIFALMFDSASIVCNEAQICQTFTRLIERKGWKVYTYADMTPILAFAHVLESLTEY